MWSTPQQRAVVPSASSLTSYRQQQRRRATESHSVIYYTPYKFEMGEHKCNEIIVKCLSQKVSLQNRTRLCDRIAYRRSLACSSTELQAGRDDHHKTACALAACFVNYDADIESSNTLFLCVLSQSGDDIQLIILILHMRIFLALSVCYPNHM